MVQTDVVDYSSFSKASVGRIQCGRNIFNIINYCASRAAFEGAFAAYSHIANLDALLRRIPVYPEAGHDERIKAFYRMAFIQHWFIHEAERHDNRYTLTRADKATDAPIVFWVVARRDEYVIKTPRSDCFGYI